MRALRRTLLKALAAAPLASAFFTASAGAAQPEIRPSGMDAMECIHSRRSIRLFQDKPVPEETLREILAAAMTAPSAGNEQPWHFVVWTDRAILARLAGINPYAKPAATSAAAILVCGDESLSRYGAADGFLPCDLGAATQNLLLAAHAKGLGAVWTGVWPKQALMDGYRQLAGLPDNVFPFALVPMGWPAQESRRENRFQEARVHLNGWS